MRRRHVLAAGPVALAMPAIARAQALPQVSIRIGGWPGYAPLALAAEAGLFRARGLDVEVDTRFMPRVGRNPSTPKGIECQVTTVDTLITWAAHGMPLTQVLVLARSRGADGIVARSHINSVAELSGKTVDVGTDGLTSFFMLGCVLRRNGFSPRDATLSADLTQAPILPETQAFMAGQFDAISTYEPYLSRLRGVGADKARVLATTLDYPVVADVLALPLEFMAKQPEVAPRLVQGWFDALEMIAREPDRAYETMGRRVSQSGPSFRDAAQHVQWQDRAMNQAFMRQDLPDLMVETEAVLKEGRVGALRTEPNLASLLDPRYVE